MPTSSSRPPRRRRTPEADWSPEATEEAPSLPGNVGPSAIGESTTLVKLDQLELDPDNVRATVDESHVADLAGSILRLGLLQPLLVREMAAVGPGLRRYQVIAGNYRLRALHRLAEQAQAPDADEALVAARARLQWIPVVVFALDEAGKLAVQLSENVMRSNLRPLEVAQALRALQQHTHATDEQMARQLGWPARRVAKFIRAVRYVEVAQALDDGVLDASSAEEVALVRAAPIRQALIARARAQAAAGTKMTRQELVSEKKRLQQLEFAAQSPAAEEPPALHHWHQSPSSASPEAATDASGSETTTPGEKLTDGFITPDEVATPGEMLTSRNSLFDIATCETMLQAGHAWLAAGATGATQDDLVRLLGTLREFVQAVEQRLADYPVEQEADGHRRQPGPARPTRRSRRG